MQIRLGPVSAVGPVIPLAAGPFNCVKCGLRIAKGELARGALGPIPEGYSVHAECPDLTELLNSMNWPMYVLLAAEAAGWLP